MGREDFPYMGSLPEDFPYMGSLPSTIWEDFPYMGSLPVYFMGRLPTDGKT
jgi:hypothetical protein